MNVVSRNLIVPQNVSIESNQQLKLVSSQNTANEFSCKNSLPNLSSAYFHPSFTASTQKTVRKLGRLFSVKKVKHQGAHLERAKKLQEFYNHNGDGVPYLLPHEVKSDKEIFKIFKLLSTKINILFRFKKLNKQTLQELINSIPEVKGKIIIQDFTDFENFLRNDLKKTEPEIKRCLKENKAVTYSNKDCSILYFNFKKMQSSNEKIDRIGVLCSVKHELLHALKHRLQNTTFTDMYKNDYYKCSEQHGLFTNIFHEFQNNFRIAHESLLPAELTDECMLDKLGCYTEDDLYKRFERRLNEIIHQVTDSGEFTIGSDERGLKQFLTFMRNKSKEEEITHRLTKKDYRKACAYPSLPTAVELEALVFAKMKNFFDLKRRKGFELKPLNDDLQDLFAS